MRKVDAMIRHSTRASVRGYDKVVQLLVDNGADVNAQGGKYGNALYAASGRGYEEVVQLLLEQGAKRESD
jgi:ankyrin repeat protein